jgi:hypothetical protein
LDPQTQARVAGLRAELEALGPLFACFGRYLSTRLDHLSGADCRALATIPDQAEPMPPAAVLELLRSELGATGSALFPQLDSAPFESRVLSQSHRGWLSDGRAVALKVSRTSVLSDPDLELLPDLAGYLSSLGWPLPAARRVLDDFGALVARRTHLRAEAEALDELGRSSSDGRFGAPRVVHPFTTARILTVEVPSGASRLAVGADGEVTPQATARARDLADLWMHLVFRERRVLEEFSASEVLTTHRGLVLTGGVFQPLSHDAADALWRYVVAAGCDDTDEVFEAMRALTTETDDARPEALRYQMGHVVPRRDGRFGEAPPGLPELLLAHWLQAERHGLVPGPELLAFYRGLVSLRELAGEVLSISVLRESLQVIQIARGTEHLRTAVDSELLTRSAEGAAKILTDMPRLLERAVARERPVTPASRDQVPHQDQAGGEWTLLAAWLLLAATLFLWFQRLPLLLGSWTEPALALVLTLVGLGLVRRIWRSV